MTIRNANSVVKELRRRAGVTQEEFAADICSVQSLSRIETGKSGISYIMLKKFMKKAGVNSNVYPAFRDKRDCDIYRKLYLCLRYIDVWQLEEAAQILREIDEVEYGENQLYYQQCLCYKGLIMLKSGIGERKEINDVLDRALRITKPEYHVSKISTYWLSFTEMYLFLALSYNYLVMGKMDICEEIVNEIENCLEQFPAEERERSILKEKNELIRACSLMKKGCFAQAEKLLKEWHVFSVKHKVYSELQVIVFLKGICEIYMDNRQKGMDSILNSYYVATGMGGYFAECIRPFLQREFPGVIMDKKQTKQNYIILPPMNKGTVKQDSFENNKALYFLGDLIRDVRMEKGIRQSVLCRGICNKSTLSKIENGMLIPDQELLEALLQRLGIHTGAFELYVNVTTYSFYELKQSLSAMVLENSKKEADRLFGLLLQKVNEKSAVQRQYVIYIWGMLEQDHSKKQFLLKEALYQTLPDFHIMHIQDFVLTFQEMMILIHIAKSLEEDATKAIFILYKLLEYSQVSTYETLEKARIQKEIVSILSGLLVSEKRFKEMIQLSRIVDKLLITGDYQSFAVIYENMYQVVSEREPCRSKETIHRYRKALQHILKMK